MPLPGFLRPAKSKLEYQGDVIVVHHLSSQDNDLMCASSLDGFDQDTTRSASTTSDSNRHSRRVCKIEDCDCPFLKENLSVINVALLQNEGASWLYVPFGLTFIVTELVRALAEFGSEKLTNKRNCLRNLDRTIC